MSVLLVNQPCGHPLTAREIAIVAGRLVTRCWACEVRREIAAKKK